MDWLGGVSHTSPAKIGKLTGEFERMHGPSPRPRQYNPSLTKLSLLLGNSAGLLIPAFSLHSNHAALAAAHYSSRMAQNLWTLALFLGLKSKVGFFYGRQTEMRHWDPRGCPLILHLAPHCILHVTTPHTGFPECFPCESVKEPPSTEEIEGVFCSSYNII